MGKAVVFHTPGLIPIEAFTTFGINSKPNSKNPIGHFGTGLKYAIAVLVRNNLRVSLWIGTVQYTFYKKPGKFRDKDFDFIQMKRMYQSNPLSNLWSKSYKTMPFTVELGKGWALWQAFRELYTNTLDEGGTTFVGDAEQYNTTAMRGVAASSSTYIVVEGDLFVDEYYDRHRNFLEDGLTERGDSTEAIQVIDRPSKHVYYRSMRIMDLEEEAACTYNFLKTIELTEDRTAKWPVLLRSDIENHILQEQNKERLAKVVPIPSSRRYWEHSLGYHYVSATPSKTFQEVAQASENQQIRNILAEANPTPQTDTLLAIKIPKNLLTEEELRSLATLLDQQYPGAQLTSFGGEKHYEPYMPEHIALEEGDDVSL